MAGVQEGSASESIGGAPSASESPTGTAGPRHRAPFWVSSVPWFLSAFLFLSGLFSLLSPLPLLFAGLSARRRSWLLGIAVSNAAIVYVSSGPLSLVLYSIFVLVLAGVLAGFLNRGRSVEASASFTLLAIGCACLSVIFFQAQLRGVAPWVDAKAQVFHLVDVALQSVSPETREQWLGGQDVGEWKQGLWLELPSAIAVLSLLLIWANLVVVLRINPHRLRERLGIDAGYLRNWKAPEVLLWPTILTGACLLWDLGRVSDWSYGFFKFFMSVYAIQGLSILAFVFDLWRIKGWFRSVGYLLAVFLMLPLVLSLGFFDQWFDFRAKFRQS